MYILPNLFVTSLTTLTLSSKTKIKYSVTLSGNISLSNLLYSLRITRIDILRSLIKIYKAFACSTTLSQILNISCIANVRFSFSNCYSCTKQVITSQKIKLLTNINTVNCNLSRSYSNCNVKRTCISNSLNFIFSSFSFL